MKRHGPGGPHCGVLGVTYKGTTPNLHIVQPDAAMSASAHEDFDQLPRDFGWLLVGHSQGF